MKRLCISFALAVTAALAAPAAARGEGSAPVRMWNPETVATVTGTVEAVERVEMGGDWSCLRLRLATAQGTVQVRVGPDWFVAEAKVVFSRGDRLEVKGSRLVFAGEDSMVAGEILRGAERIVLRDPAGKPVWAGK
jgi:hypothetical protein